MDERVTVAAAAERLGISKEAVRKRIGRGTLRSDRDQDGTVLVYVPASSTASGTASEDSAPLVESLQDQVRYLRDQLEREQEAHREARRIIAGLVQRLPELEAPERAEEGSHSPAEAEEGPRPGPADREAQEGTRKPWWRRWFGG